MNYDQIAQLMEKMAKDVSNNRKTPQQSIDYFLSKVKKQDLINLYMDKQCDAGDAVAIKEILKAFYNYEISVH